MGAMLNRQPGKSAVMRGFVSIFSISPTVTPASFARIFAYR